MAKSRYHVSLDDEVVDQVDEVRDGESRSAFLEEAARREINRRKINRTIAGLREEPFREEERQVVAESEKVLERTTGEGEWSDWE